MCWATRSLPSPHIRGWNEDEDGPIVILRTPPHPPFPPFFQDTHTHKVDPKNPRLINWRKGRLIYFSVSSPVSLFLLLNN